MREAADVDARTDKGPLAGVPVTIKDNVPVEGEPMRIGSAATSAQPQPADHEVVRRIRDGGASLGICWDAADFGGLQTQGYRSDHLAAVVHAAHPLATQTHLSFAQTLPYEQVSMPAASAVQGLLQREAARTETPLVYRTIVSNFDAALRVVGAGIALGIVPLEVAQPYTAVLDVRVIPLTDAWAKRDFAICFKSEAGLSPAARLLLAHLAGMARATTPTALAI